MAQFGQFIALKKARRIPLDKRGERRCTTKAQAKFGMPKEKFVAVAPHQLEIPFHDEGEIPNWMLWTEKLTKSNPSLY